MTSYHCSACGRAAEVSDGKVAPSCECAAAIIAELQATAYGESRVAGPKE